MKRFLVLILGLLLTVCAYCEDIIPTRSGLELSCYLSQKNSIGKLNNHSGGNLSGGFEVDYTLPQVSSLGFSTKIEFGASYIASPRIQNWNILNGTVGIFYDLPFTPYFTLRPEASYGAMLNFITLEEENKFFVDQMIQLALSFKVTSDEAITKGISLFVAPIYTFSPEKKAFVQYFGFRAGITYEF